MKSRQESSSIPIQARSASEWIDRFEATGKRIHSLALRACIARQVMNACLVASGLLILPGVVCAEEKNNPKDVTLFDGKTFDGWEGNLKVFRIEDGAIVGGSLKKGLRHNQFLCTKKEYGDFELRLKVRLVGKNVNAGVQIRSKRAPKGSEVIGYQADLGGSWWGKLYDESRRRKMLAGKPFKEIAKSVKTRDWNEYVIRCEGKRLQFSLNGVKTVDYTEPDDKIEQKGIIGLQIHSGGPSEAWYKEIVIRKL